MRDLTIKEQIERRLGMLPNNLQRKVLDYISQLNEPGLPLGVSGDDLVKFAGTLPEQDAHELAVIIEDGCEKIDDNEW